MSSKKVHNRVRTSNHCFVISYEYFSPTVVDLSVGILSVHPPQSYSCLMAYKVVSPCHDDDDDDDNDDDDADDNDDDGNGDINR